MPSSHIWTDISIAAYPYIEILFPPLNTISEIQLMDADIISSTKRQWQHASIEMIEDGKSSYKIDQLIAMYQSAGYWRTIDSSVLINCWRYSTLLVPIDAMSVSDIQVLTEEDSLDVEFTTLLQGRSESIF